MSLTPNDSNWIDQVVEEPRPQADGTSLTNRVRFPNYYRVDAVLPQGVAQLYHYQEDMDAKHDTACYMIGLIGFNQGGMRSEFNWVDTDNDLWIASASGHSMHHALLRVWFGADHIPDTFDAPPNARRAVTNARRDFEAGRLLEQWLHYARGFGKKRLVAWLPLHNDIMRVVLTQQGFTAEEDKGDAMRYFYEVD